MCDFVWLWFGFCGGEGMVYVVLLTFFCRYSGFLFLRKNLKFGWVEGGEDLEELGEGKNVIKNTFNLKIVFNNKNTVIRINSTSDKLQPL